MSKVYSMRFGSGDPRTFTGLAPTFLIFVRTTDGQTIAPPSITESLTSSGLYQFTFGTTQPIAFLADAATTSPGTSARYVTGQIDPADRTDEYASTMIALGNSGVALGTTAVALGTSAIALGTTAVSWGSAIGSTLGAIGLTLLQGEVNLGTTLVAIGNSSIALGNTILASVTYSALAIGSTASSYGGPSADPVDLFGYLKRIQENLEGNSDFTKLTGVWNIKSRAGATLLISKTIANSASMVTKT